MNYFIASLTIFERPAKIALALKRAGHNVFLIYCIEPKDEFLKECFTECYKVENSAQIDNLLLKLNVKLIHVFSTFTDQLALYLINNKKLITIYDYKDIFEGLIKLPFEKEYYQQQNFLINTANYVCHRDFQINDYEAYKGINSIKKFYYPDLVWSNQPIIQHKNQIRYGIKDKIKLVLLGNFTVEKIEPQWAGMGYIAVILSLLAQGFEVHLYPTSPHASNHESFSDYQHLSRQYPSLFLHQAKGVLDLHADLYRYDFGIVFPQCKYFDGFGSYVDQSLFRSSFPTRVMDYIGAGLPVLYYDEFKQINILNCKYKFGMAINKKKFFELQKVVDNSNLYELKKNVINAATYGLSSNRWVEKLVDFYESILN